MVLAGAVVLSSTAAGVMTATTTVVLVTPVVFVVIGTVLALTAGDSVVSGDSDTPIGNVVVVVEPVPGRWIAIFAALDCAVIGRLVLNPNGDSTEENRFWSCSMIVPAGAGTLTSATDGAFDSLVGVLCGGLCPDVLIVGPLALAVEPELPGRTKPTSDTTAKATPATSMMASICS